MINYLVFFFYFGVYHGMVFAYVDTEAKFVASDLHLGMFNLI